MTGRLTFVLHDETFELIHDIPEGEDRVEFAARCAAFALLLVVDPRILAETMGVPIEVLTQRLAETAERRFEILDAIRRARKPQS